MAMDLDATLTVPLAITGAMLTDCSVAEPDTDAGEVAYDVDDTYGFGDQVVSATTHRTYRSLQVGNHGKPLPVAPETATAWWRDIGPTNRWRALDLDRATGTTAASPMVYEINPGERCSVVALFGGVADTARIEAFLGATTVFDQTFRLRWRKVSTWREYLTTRFSVKKAVWALNIPIHSAITFRITLTRAAGDVTLGSLVLGRWEDIGQLRTEFDADEEDFSRITRDDFGGLDPVEGRAVPSIRFETIVEPARIGRLRDLRTRARARPVLVLPIADPDDPLAETMATIGILRRFTIPRSEDQVMFIPFEAEEI